MQKKLIITIDERVLNQNLEYKEMAQNKMRETEALEWSEATIGDVISKLDEVYEKATSGLDNDLLKAQTTRLPKEKW